MKFDIFLAGASRGVGREVAQLLTQQHHRVKALLRSDTTRSELEGMGVTVLMGDALEAIAVEKAMTEASSLDAVISTLGGLPQDGKKPDYEGNKNLIDAAVNLGVKRFILVSSLGCGESAKAIPPQALESLRPVLIEKEKAEQYLINSGLIYTIIRPGGLKSEPATGQGLLSKSCQISGTIHRADVAQLVIRCLSSETANNMILSAVDRNMMYGQTEDLEEVIL